MDFEILNKLKNEYILFYKKHCLVEVPLQEHLDEANEILRKICGYLDSIGYVMPASKYVYKADDITTWKYLESKCSYSEKKRKWTHRDVYNPNFRFGYLTKPNVL